MNTKFFLVLLYTLMVAACSKDEKVEPTIIVNSTEEAFILGAKENSKLSVTFFSTLAWQAEVNVGWAVVSPSRGDAGDASVAILAKEENRTGEERTAILILKSGEITKKLRFTQAATDILNVGQTDYNISADGADIKIDFTTNIHTGIIKLTPLSEVNQWLMPKSEADTRALRKGSFELVALPNITSSSRTAKFKIQIVDTDDENEILMESSLITIKQEKAPVGTSTDLVTDDKKVIVLQTHSIGSGIPLVFMGDGFLDKDITSGYYQQVMEKAMSNFFTEEPVKSLREYFDVWAVTAVSQNNSFEKQYNTKFSCELEGGGSTGITGNHDKVGSYAKAVPELADNPELFNETMAIVILNTEAYAGTTYFGFTINGRTSEFAIGYCPVINGMQSENFRQVLCHECIGHGFAKLLDEYSYREMGEIPVSEIENNHNMQVELGWAMNVDFTSDRNKVIWKHFLTDERYIGKDSFEETLGVYEGSCTYWSGAYRPTNESMMRSNTHGFNAPSREAIYKRAMETAYGSNWEYNYEEFVEFDLAHLPQPAEVQSRVSSDMVPMKPFAAPRFVNRPLNEE